MLVGVYVCIHWLCFYIYRGIRYGNRRFIERTLYDNKTYTQRDRYRKGGTVDIESWVERQAMAI